MSLFSLGGFFSDLWMDLWISLNSVVYQLIEWLYEVFELVANVNLFSEKVFNDFTDRIYIIVGITMLFIFAYNIVLMIINPDDKKSTGNTTKIVKETIIALVLIILLPVIFRYMTVFQNHILSSHIIESIILGDKSDSGTENCNFDEYTVIDADSKTKLNNSCEEYKKLDISQKGAYLVAPTLFTAFFAPTDYSYNDCLAYVKGETYDSAIDTDDDKELCTRYVYDVNMAKFSGGILVFTSMDGVYTDAMHDGFFDFNYLMAFIAGILAVYMFFCYTMEIGVRVAKLGFLQLISPIPVMLRIIPKQKEAVYDKWFKHLLNTYLDVFIRLAIIYFSMFAISLVPDVMSMLLGANYGKGLIGALAAVVVILGLLKFAQEAPALFKEFFGNSGRFALKSPRKQLSENKLAMAGLGMARSGFGAGARNMFKSIRENKDNGAKGVFRTIGSTIAGVTSGAKRGAKAGYGSTLDNLGRNSDRAIEETTDRRVERAKYKALHGGTIRGAIKGHFMDNLNSADVWIGHDSGRDIIDSIKYEEDVVKHYSDYESLYKSGGYTAMDNRLKEMKAALKSGHGYDGINHTDLQSAIEKLETQMRDDRVTAIKNNLQNAAYVAYEFSQSISSNPSELSRIRDKLKISDDDLEKLKGLTIKDNKVVNADGTAVDAALIERLLEGGYVDPSTGEKMTGLNGSSGALKGQLSADKLSVAYKHQTKLEQERKEKDSKK